MWVFLSRRLRRWVLLAIALPLARKLVHTLAARAQRTNPDASTTRLLGRADSAMVAVSGRGRSAAVR